MKALDTNAISALFEGEASLLRLLDPESRLALPVIALGEYRYGIRRSRAGRRLEALLDELVRESIVIEVTVETAEHYAHVRERLRAAGQPIPENDVWLAALCVQHDLELVTRDAHFGRVEGLRTTSW